MSTMDLINNLLKVILDNSLLIRDATILVQLDNIINPIYLKSTAFQIDEIKYEDISNQIFITLK